MENIVYEYDFGHETYGKIVKIENIYQCYETPLFGGEWQKVGGEFNNIENAKTFLHSLT